MIYGNKKWTVGRVIATAAGATAGYMLIGPAFTGFLGITHPTALLVANIGGAYLGAELGDSAHSVCAKAVTESEKYLAAAEAVPTK